jgi:hypothetical protein
MQSHKVEYVILHRVQDYWLDYVGYVGHPVGGAHRYLDEAKDALERLRKDKPNKDFKLVKRKCTITDEEV